MAFLRLAWRDAARFFFLLGVYSLCDGDVCWALELEFELFWNAPVRSNGCDHCSAPNRGGHFFGDVVAPRWLVC